MVLSVQMGYVVANMDGVAPQTITVEMVAKANVSQQLHLPNQPQPPHLVVVVVMLAASSASLYSMNCLNNKFSTAKERFSELENRLEKYQP